VRTTWSANGFEERKEARLTKMMVARRNELNAAITHHGEGDAIGESPLLVVRNRIQIKRHIEERPSDGNNFELCVCVARLHEGSRARSIELREAIAHFYEDGLGGDERYRRTNAGKQHLRPHVIRISRIQQRENKPRVEENALTRHAVPEARFGAPYR